MIEHSLHKQSLLADWLLNNNSTFLDIGCGSPYDSVCYPLLQKGWDGNFLDIDRNNQWNSITNNYHVVDALQTDWSFVKESPDYVSIDVEGLGNRFRVLERLNWNWDIQIITIEHDRYRIHDDVDGDHNIYEKIPQKEFLLNKGYHLLCEDVTWYKEDTDEYFPHEDWWIKPSLLQKAQVIGGKNHHNFDLYEKILTYIG